MEEEKNQDIKKADGELKSIHTYKSDVAEFIKSEGKTMADIAIAEAQKRSYEIKDEETVNRNWEKIIKVFIIILILGIVTAGVVWFVIKNINKGEPAPVISETEERPGMFISQIKEKNVSLSDLSAENIYEKINNTLSENSPFQVVYFTEKTGGALEETFISATDFFEKVNIYPPGDILRSLDKEFALGAVAGKVRFLVLKNHYYSGTFAGVLEWEKSIYDDLKNLLQLPKMQASNLSATTSSKEIRKAEFVDSVISNRDVRILKDGAGNIILIYVFTDNNTLVITSSETTMKMVAEKLLGSKVK